MRKSGGEDGATDREAAQTSARAPLGRAGGRIARWARRIAGSEDRAAVLLVALGFAIVIASVVVARWIVLEVLAERTQAFDERALLRIDGAKERLGARRAFVDGAALDITALGSLPVLTLLTVAATGYLWLARRRAEALLGVAVAGGAGALSALLKHWIGRPRPTIVQHGQVFSSSFPSGHAMTSMAIYIAIGIFLARLAPTWSARVFATGLAIAVAVLVASSRIYLGVHYPTDVAAGALLGLAWALAVLTAAEVFRRARS
jgi:undecaprenyl-diphosphatase